MNMNISEGGIDTVILNVRLGNVAIYKLPRMAQLAQNRLSFNDWVLVRYVFPLAEWFLAP